MNKELNGLEFVGGMALAIIAGSLFIGLIMLVEDYMQVRIRAKNAAQLSLDNRDACLTALSRLEYHERRLAALEEARSGLAAKRTKKVK